MVLPGFEHRRNELQYLPAMMAMDKLEHDPFVDDFPVKNIHLQSFTQL
jgi:hypothetical protein